MSLSECCLISLPKISDPSGNLAFVENARHIPFEMRRVYYLFEVQQGAIRGGHAHKSLQQFIIPVHGSFNVLLDDGVERRNFYLDCANQGLYICPMIWRELSDFSEGSVCLVLASDFYDESDYYRDYQQFSVDCSK